MNKISNLKEIRSISQTLIRVPFSNIEHNKIYVVKLRTQPYSMKNYIGKFAGDNFIAYYEREPRESIIKFNTSANARKWTKLNPPVSIPINILNNRISFSEIYLISLSNNIIANLEPSIKNNRININTLPNTNKNAMLSCPICITNIKNKFLPCGHCLCDGCLSELLKSVPCKCPVCSKSFTRLQVKDLFL